MKYKMDGSPISSAVPTGTKNRDEHRSLFGIYRGLIIRPIYPDEAESVSKERIEYVVKVKGQIYPNAIEMKIAGGKFNYSERVRKPTEKSESGEIKAGTYNNLLDGEWVYVAFLEGFGNTPLILGGADHPLRGKYKKFKKSQGIFKVEEFNGVEVAIDKDANYTITHVGLKDAEGKIKDEKAVGAVLKLFGNGNILFDAAKTADNKELKMLFDKAGKKFEIQAQDNTITADDVGVKVQDKNGNIVEMKNGEVKITVAGNMKVTVDGDVDISATGDAKINADGDVDIKASGDAKVKADGSVTVGGTSMTTVGESASPTKVDGAQVMLAGGGPPVARLGDMVVGVGNLGIPVVSNILQGSPKVTAG